MGSAFGGLALEAAEILERFAAFADELGEAPMANVARRQARRLARLRFTVAVVAGAGRGAGPLVNALLGRDALPERRPRDAAPVRVIDADEPGLLIRFAGGKELPVTGPLEPLPEALARHAGHGVESGDMEVEEAVLSLPNPLGRQGIDLVEFPSPHSFLSHARRAYGHTDVDAAILWVDTGRSEVAPPPGELLEAMVRLVHDRIFFVVDQIAPPDPDRAGEGWQGLRQALGSLFQEPRLHPVSLNHDRETGGLARLADAVASCLREADRATQAMVGPLLWVQQRFHSVVIPGLDQQVVRLRDGRDMESLHARLKALTDEMEAVHLARHEITGAGGPVERTATEIRGWLIEGMLDRPALARFLARNVFPIIDGSPLRPDGELGEVLGARVAALFQAHVAEQVEQIERHWFALAVDEGVGAGPDAGEAVAAAGLLAREELGPPPGGALRECDLGTKAIILAGRATSEERLHALWVGGLAGLAAGALVFALGQPGWVIPLSGLLGAACGGVAPAWFRALSTRTRLKGAVESAVLNQVEPARSYLAAFDARLEAAVRQALAGRFDDRTRRLDLALSDLAALLERYRTERVEGLPRWEGYLEEARGLADRAGALVTRLHEGGCAAGEGDRVDGGEADTVAGGQERGAPCRSGSTDGRGEPWPETSGSAPWPVPASMATPTTSRSPDERGY